MIFHPARRLAIKFWITKNGHAFNVRFLLFMKVLSAVAFGARAGRSPLQYHGDLPTNCWHYSPSQPPHVSSLSSTSTLWAANNFVFMPSSNSFFDSIVIYPPPGFLYTNGSFDTQNQLF
jgi:hypothetical protein